MLFYKEKEIAVFIDKFLEGDKSAFDDIAKLVIPDIANIAYRYLGNSDDAKDITQVVLLKLYKKIKFFRNSSKLSTWIYRIVANTSIDFLRRKKNTVSLDEAITKDAESENTLGGSIEKKDVQYRIQAALSKLSRRQKNVIILKHFEGLKINQISKILGCSQSSIKTHLVRALENLKECLGGIK